MMILALVGRPLLFSSFDPVLAEARGLPVRSWEACSWCWWQ